MIFEKLFQDICVLLKTVDFNRQRLDELFEKHVDF